MSETKVRLPHELVEIEALLDESSKRVGRAVRNMKELAVSGLPTSTPGNGSPGGGKGGSSRTIAVEDAVEHTVDRVPVTSVEAMVMAGESDVAQRALAQLVVEIGDAAHLGSDVVEQFMGQRPIGPEPFAQPLQLVMHTFRCSRLLVGLDVSDRWSPVGGWDRWHRPVRRVWQLTKSWGFVPTEPGVTVQRELLASDLTGRWCRSCLRAGVREERDRNSEFCTWCRKFEQLEGFIPPFDLVHARSNDQRITEAMIVPYRQAHRARLKKAGKQ